MLGRALVERGALAVLDDRGARRCAEAIGVGFTGTLGVVLACKRKGIIREAGPIIERLRATGMYMTDDLVGQILGMAGEGR